MVRISTGWDLETVYLVVSKDDWGSVGDREFPESICPNPEFSFALFVSTHSLLVRHQLNHMLPTKKMLLGNKGQRARKWCWPQIPRGL